ncbi:PREDICTED: triadin [Chrysochloris asiatica]|uniref:Triadin n=1 Tax=Chrysochloris asiatica TaxID=185453 RepID=A0A9B0T262_CHRAS|nr:PREDICTED: triadin [Chrysochloris asiatica]
MISTEAREGCSGSVDKGIVNCALTVKTRLTGKMRVKLSLDEGVDGNASTTTTVIDSKNGSVPKSPGKVLKRTVTEDIVTTFSSPAAWLLVIALIITWSAVAVVMFDLVDYKNFSDSNIAMIMSDPVQVSKDAVEETTDWIYGFFSLLSDIISSDSDDEDDVEIGDEDIDKGEIDEPPLKRKEIHKDKSKEQDKSEKKTNKVTHREKEKEKARGKEKEKGKDKEKPEKKATSKEKNEKKEKPETKTVAKEEKKAKPKEKTEEKTKKEVKGGKQEKVKQTAAKVKEVQKTSPKSKDKDKDDKDKDKETDAASKHAQKDQYAFCRYMIDMFVQGDLKPGQSPALPPPLLTGQASTSTPASTTLEGKKCKKKKKKVKFTCTIKAFLLLLLFKEYNYNGSKCRGLNIFACNV